MILQRLPGRDVVYAPDIDGARVVLGDELGLCDKDGKNVSMHGSMERVRYTTDCGIVVDAWKLVGESVEVHILPDRAKITGPTGPELARALNSFNSPRFDFPPYVFAGKFRSENGKKIIYDKAGRSMTMSDEIIKDMPAIFALMSNLGADGGAFFHPVIARYMWGIWHTKGRPSRLQPVGYVELRDYMRVMKDDRSRMFGRLNSSSSIALLPGKNPMVKVARVDPGTNQAVLEMCDMTVIDREKDKNFKPYVIISNRPLELRKELQFRWTRVDFKGHAVFLMPVMALSDAFSPMHNMIDLLSPKQVIF